LLASVAWRAQVRRAPTVIRTNPLSCYPVMLTSREGYRGEDDVVIVVYQHANEDGKTVWTACRDRDKASEPSSTDESKEFALNAVLRKMELQRSDVDEIKVVDDLERDEKIVMQRCNDEIREPGKEGWFVREVHGEDDTVKFGSLGEAALLDLHEAYQLKKKYSQFDFDFRKGLQ